MTLFSPEQDAAFMREAMALAQEAGRCGEVPVGALVVAPTVASPAAVSTSPSCVTTPPPTPR
jgi:tRNA(Arg) A34 adenosine deaminase TadA